MPPITPSKVLKIPLVLEDDAVATINQLIESKVKYCQDSFIIFMAEIQVLEPDFDCFYYLYEIVGLYRRAGWNIKLIKGENPGLEFIIENLLQF